MSEGSVLPLEVPTVSTRGTSKLKGHCLQDDLKIPCQMGFKLTYSNGHGAGSCLFRYDIFQPSINVGDHHGLPQDEQNEAGKTWKITGGKFKETH